MDFALKTDDAGEAALLFYERVVQEIRLNGGSNTHITLLNDTAAESAVRRFALDIVALKPNEPRSFRDLVKAGSYDMVWGALRDEEIPGQTFHVVTDEEFGRLQLHDVDPRVRYRNVMQVYAEYYEQMADLSELLYFGMLKPKVQITQSVFIVWKTDKERIWQATLDTTGRRFPRKRTAGARASATVYDALHRRSCVLLRTGNGDPI